MNKRSNNINPKRSRLETKSKSDGNQGDTKKSSKGETKKSAPKRQRGVGGSVRVAKQPKKTETQVAAPPLPSQVKEKVQTVVSNNQKKGAVSSNWKQIASLIAPPSASTAKKSTTSQPTSKKTLNQSEKPSDSKINHTKPVDLHKRGPVSIKTRKSQPISISKSTSKSSSTTTSSSSSSSSSSNQPLLLVPLFKPIPQTLIKQPAAPKNGLPSALPAPRSDYQELTKVLALDCEMVGCGPGAKKSVLASVCIVNSHGNTVFFSYVAPTERVVDYRTAFSGIRREDLEGAPKFASVQQRVAELIRDRIVVGHGLANDFRALALRHPPHLVRDTAKFHPLTAGASKPRKLKWLAAEVLQVNIQTGEHSPEQDARASMLIYQKLKKDWEARLVQKRFPKKKEKEKKN